MGWSAPGRSEFMQSLIGITRPSAGAIRLDGEILVIRSPSEAIRSGIVYVPEERGRQGAIIGLPIFQNVTLPSLSRTSRSGFLKLANEFALAREYTSSASICGPPPSIRTSARFRAATSRRWSSPNGWRPSRR